MPLGQWNLPFLAHNSQRKYPLVDEATCKDTSNTIELPQDFIVGLDIPVHAAMDMSAANFFVESVGIYPTGYSVSIAYDNGTNLVRVATALIASSGHIKNNLYRLGGVFPFDDTDGKISIGSLASIEKLPTGLWQFNSNSTRIEPDAIRPIIRGVQTVSIVNGVETSRRFYGDIEIVAGTNMQIIPVQLQTGVTRFVFSAIDGEGTIEPCVCVGEEVTLPCIKTINRISPTPAGDFFLNGTDCIEIVATDNGLTFIDNCCKPCCGPQELEQITRDLARFEQQRVTQEQFLSSLEASVNAFSTVVLGSRLSDRGCVTCP